MHDGPVVNLVRRGPALFFGQRRGAIEARHGGSVAAGLASRVVGCGNQTVM